MARGPEVFGRFMTVHEPMESSARRGKGVAHAELEAAHRKAGDRLVNDVQSASSDSLRLHVPETCTPIEDELL
ncbi:UNVERIFIED_CONTAM: hypothetical protein Sradi_4926900 [Sesamum radiatum]|uniref:Uncharacterized protein n=1 Tax=Sesamum radiatum TaxID=300843 RepID=A0AAW2MD09_SESRA